MRKLFVYILMICLLLVTLSFDIFADENDSSDNTTEVHVHTKEEYIEKYGYDYESTPLYKNYEENSNLGLTPFSLYKVLNVPTYAQQTDYWCGPASALMVIDYLNYQPNLYQSQLANEMGTNTSGTNHVNMVYALRNYTGRNYGWRWSDEFANRYGPMQNNITIGLPVISGVGTYHLIGWNEARPGKNYDHYVVVHGFRELPDGPYELFYTDPWYENPVLGKHWIILEQFKNAIYKDATARAVIW